MISVVVFLGNYGKKYEGNRHNVAWHFAQALPFAPSLFWQKKFRGQYASYSVTGVTGERRQIHLLKPETYMNLSGESIGELCQFFKIPPAEVLIVHDELELQGGFVSLKWSGGLGGHNGLRSAKAVLGTADFWRLRFGIGRPDHSDVAAWVLSDFTSDERIVLSQLWPAAGELVCAILEKGPEPFAAEWAKKKLVDQKGVLV